MKIYVDDMLVKKKTSRTHVEDLKETFVTLRKHQMKLNPTKCGVTSNKFLGFMMSSQMVKANPEKIRAMQEMSPPKNISPARW